MRDIYRDRQPMRQWFLSAGVILALAANIYQFVRSEHLSRDLAAMQRNSQKQIAELREADSAVMEQSLRRIQGLSDELHQMSIATMDMANSQVERSSARLARAMDGRHQEVVSQLSTLRTDLAADTSHRLNQVSSQLEKTGSELKRVAADLGAMQMEASNQVQEQPIATPAVEQPKVAMDQPVAPPAKKPFWSKLNPFHRKKTEASLAGN